MTAAKPYYVLFAGVNGAGKSTLYRSEMWQHGAVTELLPRVNSDEILVEHGWDWKDPSLQIRAGKEAVSRVKAFLNNKQSFNQETTLCGRSILHNIRTAQDLGYYLVIYYIGLEDPEIANKRIAYREAVGGHLIDSKLVHKRYRESMNNFVQIVDLCHEAYVFDNTALLRLCGRFELGELAFYDQSLPQPQWVARLLKQIGYEEILF